MANWAKINSENIVEDTLVCDYDFIEVLKSQNIDYSYVEWTLDNPASIGLPYNENKNKFLIPKKYPSWIMDEENWEYTSPVPYPSDGKYYVWEEMTTSWVEATPTNLD
jgi:hypothetical protein